VNILLIRLRLIGDVVLTTPLLRALRRLDPAARIAYVVEPQALPVVSANPHLDEVVVAPARDARGRLTADQRLARRLRRERYDIVVDLHGGPRSAWLSRATGAPRRIGYAATGRSWAYTERIDRSHAIGPCHSVVNQWDLILPLGVSAPDPERDPTEMPVSEHAARSVSAKLAAAGIDPSRHAVVVVHVSAGNSFRRWPASSFESSIAALASADTDRRILIVSGPSDVTAARAVGERARARLREGGDRIVDAVEFDLAEFRALMDVAALFVGGDSGPLHVASTSRVPIVGLYGPTLSTRSAPWRPARFASEAVELPDLACRPCDQRRCEPGDFRCLAGLQPARVAEAAERLLSGRGAEPRSAI
jgi:lipopolysaccharide heptosyltransferase II